MDEARLLHLFEIDLKNGKLFWKHINKHHLEKLGQETGYEQQGRSNKNYWVVSIAGKKIKRGHIIYFIGNREQARPVLDHINGNSLDDRLENLRAATHAENSWNAKFKRSRNLPTGVRLVQSGRFQARISFFGKQIHLGAYDTPKEAENVYLAKRKELYGRFA